jgi:putative N6-adenine-specific DNA methylase
MIDLHIAPGLFRNFDFENFDWIDKNILEKEKWRAKTRQKDKKLEFIGTDIDSKILKVAQNNAISAGVDKYIKFYKENFIKFKQKKDCDIITNPPYNKKLQVENIQDIYNKLNNELSQDTVHGGIIT